MIVTKENLIHHLGNDLDDLEGNFRKGVLDKLRRYDYYTTKEFDLPVIDYLFLAHQQGNKSIRKLSEETSLSVATLRKIFGFCGLPILKQSEASSRALYLNWQDPEFRRRHDERGREILDILWKDSEFRELQAEAARKTWQDPEFRERQAEGTRRKWQDPEYRERQTETVREVLNRLNQDPEFRKRNAEATARASRVKHYGVPISKFDIRSILEASDRYAIRMENYQDLINRISRETSIRQDDVVTFLNHNYKGPVKVYTAAIIQDIDTGEEFRYTVVTPEETDPTKGEISYRSPVGRSLLNKRVGDEVYVNVPRGVIRYIILGIEPALRDTTKNHSLPIR